MLVHRFCYLILINLIMLNSVFASISEYIPSIEISNYQSELAYIITAGPEVVVGKDYKSACQHLTLWGYTWKIVPNKSVDPACYSATDNVLMGADTWYCADGSLAYYNIPWWSCNAFRVCPNTTWMLSEDRLTCVKPSTNCSDTPSSVSEVKLIAAIVYGEASVNSGYEEKAAIANALVRKSKSYGYATVNDYIAHRKRQISSINPPNQRVREVLCSNIETDFPTLYEIAMNALNPNGIDYANGGCFWDGNDLKTDGASHPHYEGGYRFTNPAHDVFQVGDTPPMGIEGDWANYDYTLESTAGYGHTVFWKYTQEYMAATRTPQCH